MSKLLVKSPKDRLPLRECLHHPFITKYVAPRQSTTAALNNVTNVAN